VHLLAGESIAGHGVAVATMACGDVLSPDVLTIVHNPSAVHPFDWCRRCYREANKEQNT
jgi:hypothetical protein